MAGHPDQAVDDFEKTLASSKDPRLLAWSHIYLGRMLDLECKRDEALAEYKAGYAARDGQLDTRLAAERGMKAAYVQKGHEHDCDEDAGDDAPGPGPATGPASPSPQTQSAKPNPQ